MRKSLELAPNDAESYNNLGNILHQIGKSSEAKTRYMQVLLLIPSFPNPIITWVLHWLLAN